MIALVQTEDGWQWVYHVIPSLSSRYEWKGFIHVSSEGGVEIRWFNSSEIEKFKLTIEEFEI